MRGYGELPPEVVPELNGLVSEIKAMLDQLNGFLGQGLDQDPAERLRRLEQTGDEVELLKKLERVITEQGLVDYRGRLSAILDRIESKSFEVALFGRVSSGKSSLLNHIIGSDVLPVGVNPITAVPTRIVYGSKPRILVTTAGQNPQALEIERVTEFVTEQQNPANKKRVERLIVEYPSDKLKEKAWCWSTLLDWGLWQAPARRKRSLICRGAISVLCSIERRINVDRRGLYRRCRR